MKLNKSQRRELSKTLLDISKLIVVIAVLNPLTSKESVGIKVISFMLGTIATAIFSIWGLSLLEGEE